MKIFEEIMVYILFWPIILAVITERPGLLLIGFFILSIIGVLIPIVGVIVSLIALVAFVEILFYLAIG